MVNLVPLVGGAAIIAIYLLKGNINDKEGGIVMIKTNSSEIVSMHTTIVSVDDSGVETAVVDLSATFDTNALTLDEKSVVLNKDLYVANAAEIKAQYTNFRNNVVARAQSLGYVMY